MRIWKNSENNMFNPKLRKILLWLAVPGLLFGPVHLILYHALLWLDPIDFAGSLFIIWLIKFNGAYRIMRYLAEKRLKQRDNKWKYDR